MHFLSKLCVIFLCFGLSIPMLQEQAFAQQNPDGDLWQMQNTGRLHLTLNGNWYAVGAQPTVQMPVEVPGIFSDNLSRTVNRDFFVPDSLRNKAFILHILGINYQCRIQLNGTPIASHAGGYTSFDFELKPEALRFGASNTLSIEVSGELTTRTTLPFKHRPQGWQHQLGILRDVYLEARPAVAIGEVKVSQKFQNQYRDAELALQIEVQAFSELADSSIQRQFELYCAISEDGQTDPRVVSRRKPLTLTNATGNNTLFDLTLENVQKWRPQQPILYQLDVFLMSNGKIFDRMTLPLGIRELRLQGNRFWLNGEPFFIRGVTWHESLSGLAGPALDKAISLIIARLKALGINVLRVIGYPPHPRLVERCSKEGIALFIEIPLYYANDVQLQADAVKELAAQQLEQMLARDRWQPAVLAWGLASHIDTNQPAASAMLDRLSSQARNSDDRLLYYVKRGARKTAANANVDFVLTDFFGETKPEIGVQPGAAPELPIFGFWAESGQIGRKATASERKRSEEEEAQAEKLERAIEFYRTNWPDSAGFFVHSLTDWRGPQPLMVTGSARDRFIYPAGLIDHSGNLRLGFRMVSAYHLNERKPQISPNNTQPPRPIVFPLIGIVAILLFLFFLNRDKKLRVQLRRAFVHPHGLYSDLFENRKTPAFLTLLLGGFQGIIVALLATSVFYHFRENLLFDEIITLFVIAPAVKHYLIWLVWHPGWMIFALTICYLVTMVALAVLLRMFAVFFKSTLNLFQYFTLVFWAAVNYLPLALIAPIFYRLLPDAEFAFYSMIVIALFGFWHFIRMQRGLRVFYIVAPMNAMLICLGLTSLVLGSIFLYYNQSQAILDYWDYYAALVR